MGLKFRLVESNGEKIIGGILVILLLGGMTYALSTDVTSVKSETYFLLPGETMPLSHSPYVKAVYVNDSMGELFSVSSVEVEKYTSLKLLVSDSSSRISATLLKGSSFKVANEGDVSVEVARDNSITLLRADDQDEFVYSVDKTDTYIFRIYTSNPINVTFSYPVHKLPASATATGNEQIPAQGDIILYNDDSNIRALSIVEIPRFSFIAALLIHTTIVFGLLIAIVVLIRKRTKKADKEAYERTLGTDYWQKEYEDIFGKEKRKEQNVKEE